MKSRPSPVVLSLGAAAGLSLLAGCSALPGPAAGGAGNPASPVSEVRVGGLVHDPLSPERGSVDLSGEVLFVKPFTLADPLWNALSPRPAIGGTVSLAGRTSEAYAGLAWDYDVTQRMFVEGGLGGSVNDAHPGADPPAGYSALGCDASFRESASLGYRLTPNWSVIATLEHMSNAGLCPPNRGLTNFGAQVGYAF